jgi:patatin-like phospholipase/acyl hydrolase
MKKTLAEHLDPKSGPKRILSLDGGGIRGALTMGYVKRMETLIREKENDPNLLLCDYFDMIGGTSTGSVIAAGLAIGMSADELVKYYMVLGGEIFGEKRDWWKPWETAKFLKAEYNYASMEKNLKNVFKDIKLGGSEIKTGLCITAKRADTNSTWPLINHPKGKFYNSDIGNNSDILLWQAIRASTAAPTYFAPQLLDVGNNQRAMFVDGGVSTANNPALTMLMVATLKGFPFGWEMGEDKLTVVSIGTGYGVFAKHNQEIEDAWLATWAKNIPEMIFQDSSWQNQIVLQWMSRSPTAHTIDMEMGSLDEDYIGGKPMIKYLRYNFPITLDSLNGLGLERKFVAADIEDLLELAHGKNRFDLYDIGKAAADKELKKEDLFY